MGFKRSLTSGGKKQKRRTPYREVVFALFLQISNPRPRKNMIDYFYINGSLRLSFNFDQDRYALPFFCCV